MKNYLPQITESQRQELKQRLALELLIQNFSMDDLTSVFQDASQERLSNLAYSLSEEPDNFLNQMALHKYGSMAEKMVNPLPDSTASYYVQVAQIYADFGLQHRLD